MLDQKFLRFNIDKNYPQANIYITTKEFLQPKNQTILQKKQKLNQLAMMDIIAIINFADKETLYDDILQLTPRSEQKCQDIPFNWMQGAVKFIDVQCVFIIKHVIKLQQRSVAIFCSSDYTFSHLCLVCYLIYNLFSLQTQIKDLPQVQAVKCVIDFERREITLEEDNDGRFRQYFGTSNYRFKINTLQIGEAEKFQLTKLTSQIKHRGKGGLQQNDWSLSIYQKQPKTEDLSNASDFMIVQLKFRQEMNYQAVLFAKRNEIYIIVKLFVVEADFVNPFCNLDQTTTIENIEETLEQLKRNNILAIINCLDSDQSLKHYGISYLNIHINFQEQLESARLFIHFWTKIRKSSVAIYCDSSMQKSIKVLKYYLKFLNHWSEERVQKEIQENQEKEANKSEIERKSHLIHSIKEKNQENDSLKVNKSRFVQSRTIYQQ